MIKWLVVGLLCSLPSGTAISDSELEGMPTIKFTKPKKAKKTRRRKGKVSISNLARFNPDTSQTEAIVAIHGRSTAKVRRKWKLIFDGTLLHNKSNQSYHRYMVNEAYLNIKYRKADINIGQQRIRWGQLDFSSPIDLISPKNSSTGINHSPSSQYQGVVAGLLRRYWGSDTYLELLYKPYNKPILLPPDTSTWDVFGDSFDLIDNLSNYNGKGFNHQGGLRFSTKSWNAQWALSAYSGLESYARLSQEATTTKPTPLQYISFDGNLPLGNFLLKMDIAYILKRARYHLRIPSITQESQQQNSYGLGLDYTWNDLFVTLEYQSVRWQESLPGTLIIFDDQEFTSLRVDYSWLNNRLHTVLFTQIMHADQSQLWMVQGNYRWGAQWRFEIGMVAPSGSEESVFGLFDKNDYAYVEVQYFI